MKLPKFFTVLYSLAGLFIFSIQAQADRIVVDPQYETIEVGEYGKKQVRRDLKLFVVDRSERGMTFSICRGDKLGEHLRNLRKQEKLYPIRGDKHLSRFKCQPINGEPLRAEDWQRAFNILIKKGKKLNSANTSHYNGLVGLLSFTKATAPQERYLNTTLHMIPYIEKFEELFQTKDINKFVQILQNGRPDLFEMEIIDLEDYITTVSEVNGKQYVSYYAEDGKYRHDPILRGCDELKSITYGYLFGSLVCPGEGICRAKRIIKKEKPNLLVNLKTIEAILLEEEKYEHLSCQQRLRVSLDFLSDDMIPLLSKNAKTNKSHSTTVKIYEAVQDYIKDWLERYGTRTEQLSLNVAVQEGLVSEKSSSAVKTQMTPKTAEAAK